jgi:hypothetical protein
MSDENEDSDQENRQTDVYMGPSIDVPLSEKDREFLLRMHKKGLL